MITRPMLAGRVEEGDFKRLRFPLLATPKLDGIRCLKVDGKAVSRKFKPIPNHYVRQMVEKHLPDGVDGELMVSGGFSAVSSGIMSHRGEPDFEFYIFDYVAPAIDLSSPYSLRMKWLKQLELPPWSKTVLPRKVTDLSSLSAYEAECLDAGFEGVMVRSPLGPYKCGRSTFNEGYLLKIKRWMDSEALITDMVEQLANENELQRDAFGKAKRSNHQDNMRPKGTMGALVCRDIHHEWDFNLGTGFTAKERDDFWTDAPKHIGKTIVRYRYLPTVKEGPRHPSYDGIRDPIDL